MKLISSLFSSSASSSSSTKKKNSNNKDKKKSKVDRSMCRSDTPSFGSSTTTSSTDSFAKITTDTPKTVILGRNASGLDAEYWSSTSSSSVSDLFCVFDRDGDGKITKQELELVLRRLGSDPPTEEEVAMMLAEVDRDGDGCISLEEFRALGSALAPPAAAGSGGDGGKTEEDELRDAFGIFDADGDGKISAEELLGVFVALGDEGCTVEDCRRMICGIDSDGKGFVGFDDFVRMMNGQR